MDKISIKSEYKISQYKGFSKFSNFLAILVKLAK